MRTKISIFGIAVLQIACSILGKIGYMYFNVSICFDAHKLYDELTLSVWVLVKFMIEVDVVFACLPYADTMEGEQRLHQFCCSTHVLRHTHLKFSGHSASSIQTLHEHFILHNQFCDLYMHLYHKFSSCLFMFPLTV